LDKFPAQFAAIVPTASSDQLFAEIHRVCDALVGVKLFTCSRFNLASGNAKRIYTSNETAYPLTGLKDIVPNRWTEIVLDARAPFLAQSITDLRDIFPDHKAIEALGLGAAINLPIFVSDQLLGTVNLLNQNGHYTPDSLDALRDVQMAATIAFLSYCLANP
jgi:hypothetical protein